MSFGTTFYNTIVKRNSIFVTAILAGGFALGVGFDIGIQGFWDRWNQGKQWKDIRHKYITPDE